MPDLVSAAKRYAVVAPVLVVAYGYTPIVAASFAVDPIILSLATNGDLLKSALQSAFLVGVLSLAFAPPVVAAIWLCGDLELRLGWPALYLALGGIVALLAGLRVGGLGAAHFAGLTMLLLIAWLVAAALAARAQLFLHANAVALLAQFLIVGFAGEIFPKPFTDVVCAPECSDGRVRRVMERWIVFQHRDDQRIEVFAIGAVRRLGVGG